MIKELFIKILIIAMIVRLTFPLAGILAFSGYEVAAIILWSFVGVPAIYFTWRLDLKKVWGKNEANTLRLS